MRKIGLLLLSLFIGFAVHAQNESFSLQDIIENGTFRSKSIQSLRPMKDGRHYSVLEDGKRIVQYSYKTGQKTQVLFDIDKVNDQRVQYFSGYELSDDEKRIMIRTNIKPIYRHSYTAEYFVYNSVTESFNPLSEKGAQQIATFSPDGYKVAFVRDNNIFIKNLRFGSESRITKDGKKNKIINGIPDWVYEEEFGYNKAFWWSPDSKFIAYTKFNETKVPEFKMPIYAGEKPYYKENRIYPGKYVYKYPKAGEKNSTVTVWAYELENRNTIQIKTNDEQDIYIPRLKWTPNSKNLAILQLNRHQNELKVFYANPFTGLSNLTFTEKNKRYIAEDFLNAFSYLEDGRFVVISERDGWSHLYLFDNKGFEEAQLTKGKFDVTQFYGYDAKRKAFYYQAAAESPLRREVYEVKKGKKPKKLSNQQGTNSAKFSKNYDYFINFFSNTTTPYYITLNNNNGNVIRVLQNNKALREKLSNYNLPQKEFFTFTNSDKDVLNGYMIKPADFDPNRKYPVFMTQYSGPNSQQVKDSWSGISWNEYLAQEKFIVVCVDPRGTAARGEDFRKITYMQLGKFESNDQVDAAKYLTTLPYVDANNIAIFGWSYGGFMTLLSLEKGGNLFKAGIAVAAVTNWRYYDSVYTERYMRTPQENAEGYDLNSPLNNAKDIKSELLIIHGSADDNVHAQNIFEFTEKMVQNDIPFDMAIYTNRNHGIYGGKTRMHLYKKMTNFLKNQLQDK